MRLDKTLPVSKSHRVRMVIKIVLVPPASLLLGMLATMMGASLFGRTPSIGEWFFLLAFWGSSCPWCAYVLARLVERRITPIALTSTPKTPKSSTRHTTSTTPIAPCDSAAVQKTAIVVPGRGYRLVAPEYGGGPALDSESLERVYYAAYLHQRTSWPVLVSGGDPQQAGYTEAAIMKAVLEDRLATPVSWVEAEARTTAENASRCAEILRMAGVERVALVCGASEMLRAAWLFRRVGVEVVPAPFGFRRYAKPRLFAGLMPTAEAISTSSLILYELLGLVAEILRAQIRGR